MKRLVRSVAMSSATHSGSIRCCIRLPDGTSATSVPMLEMLRFINEPRPEGASELRFTGVQKATSNDHYGAHLCDIEVNARRTVPGLPEAGVRYAGSGKSHRTPERAEEKAVAKLVADSPREVFPRSWPGEALRIMNAIRDGGPIIVELTATENGYEVSLRKQSDKQVLAESVGANPVAALVAAAYSALEEHEGTKNMLRDTFKVKGVAPPNILFDRAIEFHLSLLPAATSVEVLPRDANGLFSACVVISGHDLTQLLETRAGATFDGTLPDVIPVGVGRAGTKKVAVRDAYIDAIETTFLSAFLAVEGGRSKLYERQGEQVERRRTGAETAAPDSEQQPLPSQPGAQPALDPRALLDIALERERLGPLHFEEKQIVIDEDEDDSTEMPRSGWQTVLRVDGKDGPIIGSGTHLYRVDAKRAAEMAALQAISPEDAERVIEAKNAPRVVKRKPVSVAPKQPTHTPSTSVLSVTRTQLALVVDAWNDSKGDSVAYTVETAEPMASPADDGDLDRVWEACYLATVALVHPLPGGGNAARHETIGECTAKSLLAAQLGALRNALSNSMFAAVKQEAMEAEHWPRPSPPPAPIDLTLLPSKVVQQFRYWVMHLYGKAAEVASERDATGAIAVSLVLHSDARMRCRGEELTLLASEVVYDRDEIGRATRSLVAMCCDPGLGFLPVDAVVRSSLSELDRQSSEETGWKSVPIVSSSSCLEQELWAGATIKQQEGVAGLDRQMHLLGDGTVNEVRIVSRDTGEVVAVLWDSTEGCPPLLALRHCWESEHISFPETASSRRAVLDELAQTLGCQVLSPLSILSTFVMRVFGLSVSAVTTQESPREWRCVLRATEDGSQEDGVSLELGMAVMQTKKGAIRAASEQAFRSNFPSEFTQMRGMKGFRAAFGVSVA